MGARVHETDERAPLGQPRAHAEKAELGVAAIPQSAQKLLRASWPLPTAK